MIGNTLVETHLKKALTLDDALAWYEANTPQIKKLVLDLIRQDQLFERGVNKFDEINTVHIKGYRCVLSINVYYGVKR